jgi:hypothetical protein
MRLPVLALSIASCSLLTIGCSREITRTTAVSVLAVNGNVVFGSTERNHFQPVTLKSKIRDGDTVRSSDGASVNFVLIPGVLAQLAGSSEIKVDQLSITKDGNETAGGLRKRSVRISLHRGKLMVRFSQGDTAETRFSINAGHVTVSPGPDCSFCVWNDGANTRVTCARGEITASPGVQPPVTIAAGFFQRWPTTAAKPMAAADDVSAQIDITDSLEVGRQLEKQASALKQRRTL